MLATKVYRLRCKTKHEKNRDFCKLSLHWRKAHKFSNFMFHLWPEIIIPFTMYAREQTRHTPHMVGTWSYCIKGMARLSIICKEFCHHPFLSPLPLYLPCLFCLPYSPPLSLSPSLSRSCSFIMHFFIESNAIFAESFSPPLSLALSMPPPVPYLISPPILSNSTPTLPLCLKTDFFAIIFNFNKEKYAHVAYQFIDFFGCL